MSRTQSLTVLSLLLGFVMTPLAPMAIAPVNAGELEFMMLQVLEVDPLGDSVNTPEARDVLAAGAEILNLPKDNTYALTWFPEGFQQNSMRRTLFVLHDETGNAYRSMATHLPMARQYGYALVALQWKQQNGEALDPKSIHRVMGDMMPYLVTQYALNPNRMALAASGQSASLSYEIAAWDTALNQRLFRLVIAESGGVSGESPRPLIARLKAEIEGKLPVEPLIKPQPPKPQALTPDANDGDGKPALPASPIAIKPATPAKKPPALPEKLRGQQFMLMCGTGNAVPNTGSCDAMHNARTIIEGQGGRVVQFVQTPSLGVTDWNHATHAFLSATK